MSGLHFHPLRVRDVRADTDEAMLLTFDVPPELSDAFRFEPGQYLTLRHPANSQDLRRSYSICAAAGEALRVGVRRVDGGAFSSWLHATVAPGQVMDVMEPQGRFGASLAGHMQAQGGGHMLCIAGGSGITPILSILKTVLMRHITSRVTLLYGNRDVASTMFKEELEDLKNRYLTRLVLHPVFSREQIDTPLHCGRLDRDKIATFLRLIGAVDEAFICGPHAFNDDAEAALLAAGIAPARLHVERFGVPPALARQVAQEAQDVSTAGTRNSARIRIVRDGVTRDIGYTRQDQNILAAASRAGLDVPYSCKSGVCATCRSRLIEGEVHMARNFALEPSEVEAGFILTCQAHPLTERVVISFDDR